MRAGPLLRDDWLSVGGGWWWWRACDVTGQGIRTSLINERIPQRRNMDVLNGIAYDRVNGRLWVTGKLWPKLYEVELRQIQWPPEMDLAHARRSCIVRGGRV
jgi:hypothetical protein